VQHFDTIIIGGGHNGLVCANYLGKAGQKVLLIEASKKLGGLAATREFYPGFRASVAHAINQFPEKIVLDLNLTKFGYKQSSRSMKNIGLDLEGNHVFVTQDGLSGVSDKEVRQYDLYIASLKRFAKALQPFWMKKMPAIGGNTIAEILTFIQIGLKLKLLGKKDMRELLRVVSLPARDLMDENFDSDLLKATLSWDALVGSTQAPRSPNNSILTLLYRMAGNHHGHYMLPEGGVQSLIDALTDAAKSVGVEIRCDSPVKKISVKADKNGVKAEGVILDGGEEITGDRVISALDPKQTFINLVGAEHLEIEFLNRINRLRTDGYVAKLHLALSDIPSFTGIETLDDRFIIAPTMDTIEFAWDDAKYGQCPENPVIEIVIPSLNSPALSPEGGHVLSANIMYIPYRKKGGWSEESKAHLVKKLLNTLNQYSPGLSEKVIHAELLTPVDLEKDWRVTGGHWHHTELALDQMLMMRPTYEAAQYQTPVDDLYICGAGCHPGGGLMGAAGFNAAKVILT
jgi:phytoene dehydrogenase-like protein